MLLSTNITGLSSARQVPKDLTGTPQVPIRLARFGSNNTVISSSTTAFLGAEYFNAPAFTSDKLDGAATHAVVALDQYNYLKLTPFLRHASAVSNTTAALHVWLLWGGLHNGLPFLRGEYRGKYDLVAGSKVLPSTDPLYSSTAQTAHCDTITPSLDSAPIDTPVITGGATAAQQRNSITMDQEAAIAVVLQLVNASNVSGGVEIGQL